MSGFIPTSICKICGNVDAGNPCHHCRDIEDEIAGQPTPCDMCSDENCDECPEAGNMEEY